MRSYAHASDQKYFKSFWSNYQEICNYTTCDPVEDFVSELRNSSVNPGINFKHFLFSFNLYLDEQPGVPGVPISFSRWLHDLTRNLLKFSYFRDEIWKFAPGFSNERSILVRNSSSITGLYLLIWRYAKISCASLASLVVRL